MAVYGGPEIVSSGLVLYLDAGNSKSYPGSGTSWNDLSGNGNNGTLTNGPIYNSVRNGTLILDGTNDYIDIPNNSLYQFTNTQPFTLSIWLKCTNLTGSTNVLGFALFSGNYRGYYLQITISDTIWTPSGNISKINSFIFDYNDGTLFRGIIGNDNSITIGSWINLVATSSSNSVNDMKVYQNGVLTSWTNRGSQTPSNINYTSVPLRIGSRETSQNFSGNISSVQIYNRALSASEILNNYNALKGRYASYLTDPDAITYVAAVEAADGQELERSVALAYQSFIVGCKADNIWSAIKASCILMGARTLAGALVPLAGTAPTNNNFVSADYNRKTGLAGDGSSKYLNSNRGNSTDPQDDIHISCYASSAGAGNNVYVGVVYDSNTSIQPPDWIFNRGRSAGIGGSTPTGFIGTSRSNANNFDRRINGSTGTISGISIAPVTSDKFFIFARNVGYPQQYSSARLSFYSIGTSLDLSKLDTRVSALYTAIGAAIP